MTPEEKAKEILDYLNRMCGSFGNGLAAANFLCDEMIKEVEPDALFQRYNERVTYWKDVKEAIEKF